MVYTCKSGSHFVADYWVVDARDARESRKERLDFRTNSETVLACARHAPPRWQLNFPVSLRDSANVQPVCFEKG